MRKFLIAVLVLFSLSVSARDDLDDVMEVLKYVESLNDPTAIGDGGDSYLFLVIIPVLHPRGYVSSGVRRRSFQTICYNGYQEIHQEVRG